MWISDNVHKELQFTVTEKERKQEIFTLGSWNFYYKVLKLIN